MTRHLRLAPRLICTIGTVLLALHVAAQAAPQTTIATFSIVARDPSTGELGVAVQSRFFAVGAAVPFAEGDVGAIASQAMGNPIYGTRGLQLLREGRSVQETLASLLEDDPQHDHRQVGIVDAKGRSVAHTGSKAFAWAGHRTGPDFAVQGNILVSEQTVVAMERAFTETRGMLGERMIRALEEGQKAGGDSRGGQSAALLIVKKGAGYAGTDRYCDLRVDDHTEPIKELRRLFTVWRVRALMMEGYRLLEMKDFARAIALGDEAVALDPSGESHYHSACFLARAGRVKEALRRLQEAIARNPKLAPRAAQDPDFEPLRNTDAFKQIIGK
jgi:uncharacterized Ntn-hydrolase superfamily protein